jgi:hypothetical protein
MRRLVVLAPLILVGSLAAGCSGERTSEAIDDRRTASAAEAEKSSVAVEITGQEQATVGALSPGRQLDLCAWFPKAELETHAATVLEAGRNEYVDGGLAGGPGTNLCTWESAAGQPYALVKIRFTRATNVSPASASYSVDDLGDSAFVDRAFAATTVLVGANAFTVQVAGVRDTSDEIAAAHPELVAAEGPATTSELQASLAIALALSDRFAAGD